MEQRLITPYYEYNELGDLKEYRLETADGVILSREKHAYDADGNTTTITYNDGSKHSFQYDLASRLKNEQKISSSGAVLSTISYQYDPYGNRLSITKNGTTTTYKYDSANQISSVNGSAGIYQYDQNGNQIRDDRHKYYYDSSNRLSYVEQANAVVAIASYSYDYEGKRTKKVVYGKKTEHYYYDAGHLTYIADENNQILYSFTRTYTGDLVTMTDYTSGVAVNYYYIHNGHGDIIGLKDKTGTTVVTYEYDAFGNIVTSTGTAKTGNGRLVREENPFRYASYFYDEETKLYYLRMRFYDPSIGRYLTRDIVPSANLYVYTENNPVRFVDPFGLSFFSKIKSLYQKVKKKVIEFFKPVYNSVATTIKSIKTKKVEFSPGQQAAITIGAAGVGSSVDYKASKTNSRISSQQSAISNAIHVGAGTDVPKRFIKNLSKVGLYGTGVGVAVDWGMSYLRKEEFGAEELKESFINNFALSLASAGIAGVFVAVGVPVLGAGLIGAVVVSAVYAGYTTLTRKTIADWFD